MALTNAERQKRYRTRIKEQASNAALDYIDMERNPTAYARTILAALVAVLKAGTAKAGSSIASSDTLLLDIESDPGAVADDARDILSSWMTEPWLSQAAVRLWDDSEPMRFAVRIEAVSDKRKLRAAERKLQREADEEEEEDVT